MQSTFTCAVLQGICFPISIGSSVEAFGNYTMENHVEVTVLPDGRLNAKNAAAYLGLSVKTLAMKRCSGEGPKFVKRGRIFYFKKDLDFWLREGN
jgi:hypothetical protein